MCTDKLPHLCDVDKLDDDVWSLLWCGLTQHHALNPLRQSVEERDRTLQSRIVPQHSLRGVVLEIAELWSRKHWHLIRSQLVIKGSFWEIVTSSLWMIKWRTVIRRKALNSRKVSCCARISALMLSKAREIFLDGCSLFGWCTDKLRSHSYEGLHHEKKNKNIK